MNDTDLERLEMLGKARLGRAIDAERHTPTMQLLLEKAHKEKMEAAAEFAYLNPSDTKAIIAAQMRVRAANLIGGWIAEAIETGKAYEQALQSEGAAEPRA
jgi:hypothetical protein